MYVSFCPVRRSPSAGFRPWGCPLPQTVPGGRRPAPMPGRRRGLRCRWAGRWTAHPSWDPSARANEPRPKPSVHLFFEHRSELEHLFLKHRAAKHSSYFSFCFAQHTFVSEWLQAPGRRISEIKQLGFWRQPWSRGLLQTSSASSPFLGAKEPRNGTRSSCTSYQSWKMFKVEQRSTLCFCTDTHVQSR